MSRNNVQCSVLSVVVVRKTKASLLDTPVSRCKALRIVAGTQTSWTIS